MEDIAHSNRTAVIILAAGKGTRMNGTVPKVLMPLGGKPMMVHLLEAVEQAGLCKKPLVVVGNAAEKVRSVLGDRCEYVFQSPQVGTGHAVGCAQAALQGNADSIIVLYGDHPLIQPQTIQRLARLHCSDGKVMTMLTAVVDDFEDWRKPWDDFGRVVRSTDGEIQRVVEVKDATPEQRMIREVNLGLYCFDAQWLWTHLPILSNQNAQQEYHLVGLIEIALAEGRSVASLIIDPRESMGINTPEHLVIAERFLQERTHPAI